ncbi:hypothetical protein [Camelimonas lactis]|uniref:hypothetical protein n=2 Tax=Camelimonas lactis TaxID=659006 RepID=UPI00140553F4|nr:hypothetical protein [Camelimonas lactis]
MISVSMLSTPMASGQPGVSAGFQLILTSLVDPAWAGSGKKPESWSQQVNAPGAAPFLPV